MKAIFENSIPFENKKSGNQSAMPTDNGFGDFANNSEKFQKIMKNLKYWKTVFETEIDQIRLSERSNQIVS